MARTTPPDARSSTATLDEVLLTDALHARPGREPDHAAENLALRTLVRSTAGAPSAAPAALARIARELCGADSAGLSLIDRDDEGAAVLRWVALAGRLAGHEGGTTPRDWSPCGTCLDLGTPQLFDRPARHFTYLEAADIVEALVVPLGAHQHLGTLWVVAHGDERRFDREDARVLESLADVAVASYERTRAQDLAEQALRAQDRLFSMVGHDLRNVLSVVLMNSAMLSRQATALGAEDLLRWAEKTRRASDQMSRLVGDVLDSAALETGRLQLVPVPTDPTALLRDAAAGLETFASSRRVTIEIAPDSVTGHALRADPGRLRQVLENLLVNAIKVSPAGGLVTAGAALDGADLVLWVADEGPGMEPVEASRLLPRLEPADEERGGGTERPGLPGASLEGSSSREGGERSQRTRHTDGLGLWIANRLVAAHGGRLRVEAREDGRRGSVFRAAFARLDSYAH